MADTEQERLQAILLQIAPKAYFQPPSNVKMDYPCIVYRKSGIDTIKANNKNYHMQSVYQLTVIDRDPDSKIPENILNTFTMCNVNSTGTTDNLHHTYLTLYY